MAEESWAVSFLLQHLECFPSVGVWPWCCGGSSKPPLSPSAHSCSNNCSTLLLKGEVNELCTAQAAQASQLGSPFDRKKSQMCPISCTASHSHLNKAKNTGKFLNAKRRKQTRTQVRTKCIAIKSYLGHTCFKYKKQLRDARQWKEKGY